MLKYDKSAITLAIAAAMGLVTMPAQADPLDPGFQPVSNSGTPVLIECAGIPATSEDDPPYYDEMDQPDNPCELDPDVVPPTTLNGTGSFPGRSGTWQLVSRQCEQFFFGFCIDEQMTLTANGDVIGWYLDRVYRRTNSGFQDQYVLATYLHLDEETEWTEPDATNISGLSGMIDHHCDEEETEFEVNDIYRDIGTDVSNVMVAFRESPSAGFGSESVLYASGRTDEGIAHCIGTGEAMDTGTQTCPGFDPVRDNTRINFRADVSPEDDDGTAPPNSMWYYVYLETSEGVSSTPTGTVSFESGGEELQCRYRADDIAFEPNDA